MSVENLDKIFQPKSIAVVGASERKGSVGAALMHNLIERGFSGQIFPINPNHKKIGKLAACPSIRDLEVPVDLAIISTPITLVPQIVKDCVDVGVGGAVIISAGGKEIGEPGKKLEAAIQKEAGHSGLRIIGPNCVGIMSSRSKLNASFANQMPIAGKMAFISQSGAICTAILDLSIKENIGFSYFVSLGDMLDVDFGDMIDYLGGEADVGSIVMYVESLTNFRKFMSAARAVSRVKPIIVLKAGRTQAGALAAASHTGAMAGEDSVYDAAFQRAGILRVKTFEELFDCAELLAKQPKPAGPGLAIITNAGGPGVMAADALSDFGYEPVSLSTTTFQKLDEILPPYWSKRNPIDMLGEAKPALYRQVVEICLNAKEVNGLLIISAPQALADTAEVAAALVDLIREKPIPITQIDYDRHIALVALSLSNSQEAMLGVARVILAHNPKEAEFSIIVGDPWQGKGIGAALLSRCISIAKERGIQKVMGAVLAENTQMLALGKKFGFKINKVVGAGEYELSIDFQTN